jgi:hypothetical protein
MKTANRKMFLPLLGIAVATPFIGLALILGTRVSALGNSLQGDLLVVVLALASLVAGIGEGRLVLKREVVPARRGNTESAGEADPCGVSQFHHGY